MDHSTYPGNNNPTAHLVNEARYDYDTTNPDSARRPPADEPYPLDVPKFIGGMIGVAVAGAATAVIAAMIIDRVATGVGLPWAQPTFTPGTAAAIAIIGTIISAAVFVLAILSTNSADGLLAAYGWIAIVLAVIVPFLTTPTIVWPATAVTALSYAVVVAVITYLTRMIGDGAKRRGLSTAPATGRR